jgi:hypothetical protein
LAQRSDNVRLVSPVKPFSESWCEGEKRMKKDGVGALMTEKRLFKYTELAMVTAKSLLAYF